MKASDVLKRADYVAQPFCVLHLVTTLFSVKHALTRNLTDVEDQKNTCCCSFVDNRALLLANYKAPNQWLSMIATTPPS